MSKPEITNNKQEAKYLCRINGTTIFFFVINCPSGISNCRSKPKICPKIGLIAIANQIAKITQITVKRKLIFHLKMLQIFIIWISIWAQWIAKKDIKSNFRQNYLNLNLSSNSTSRLFSLLELDGFSIWFFCKFLQFEFQFGHSWSRKRIKPKF